jgi:hypothetical protein
MENKEFCLLCGHLSEVGPFCAKCEEEGQKLVHSIHALIRKYPAMTIIEICRTLDLPFAFIKGLIGRGYLSSKMTKTVPQEEQEQKPSGFHRKRE